MKKIFSVILISMLVMSGVFATVTNVGQSTGLPTTEASVDVALDITADDINSYAFGFSAGDGNTELNNDSDVTAVPGAFVGQGNVLRLGFDKVKGIGTNGAGGGSATPIYFYWKIKTASTIELTITPSELTDTQESPAAPLKMYVKSDVGSPAVKNGAGTLSIKTDGGTAFVADYTAPKTIVVKPSGALIEYNAGSISLDVYTDKVGVLAKDATYTGTISVAIATQG